MSTLHHHQRLHLLPDTRLARIALRVVVGAILTLLAIGLLVSAGATGVWLGIPSLLALICLVAAGVVALFAILKRGERSLLALLIVVVGMLPLLFLIGEFTSPH